MDIPKFVGVVYDSTSDDNDSYSTHTGNDEEAVKAETLAAYTNLVRVCRSEGVPESDISQIGWDVYVSTRASANSPDAVHHGFNGPGA
jgi:hypothetical protein